MKFENFQNTFMPLCQRNLSILNTFVNIEKLYYYKTFVGIDNVLMIIL